MNWRKHTEQESLAKRRKRRRLIHGAAVPAPSLDVELAAHLLSATLVRRGDRRAPHRPRRRGQTRSTSISRRSLEGARRRVSSLAIPADRGRRREAGRSLEGRRCPKLMELERRENPPGGHALFALLL